MKPVGKRPENVKIPYSYMVGVLNDLLYDYNNPPPKQAPEEWRVRVDEILGEIDNFLTTNLKNIGRFYSPETVDYVKEKMLYQLMYSWGVDGMFEAVDVIATAYLFKNWDKERLNAFKEKVLLDKKMSEILV